MARSKVWTGSVWAYEDDVVSSENTFKPVIDVTAPIGTSITVSNGSIGFTRTSTEETTRFDIPSWGTWTVSGTVDGALATRNVDVRAVQIYDESLRRLPSAYREVEYIESTGTQYINLNYVPSKNSKLVYTAQRTVLDGTERCIGGCGVPGQSAGTLNLGITRTNNSEQFYFYWTSSTPTIQLTDTDIHNYVCNDSGKMVIDDTIIGTFSSINSFVGSLNLYLFAYNLSGSASIYAKLKLYSFKIYENGTLLKDLVPCYRVADNKVGLYDVENNYFYSNAAGSGDDFNKGGNV